MRFLNGGGGGMFQGRGENLRRRAKELMVDRAILHEH